MRQPLWSRPPGRPDRRQPTTPVAHTRECGREGPFALPLLPLAESGVTSHDDLVAKAPVRLLAHGADSPARNMAVDEALLREARAPVLRLYRWNAPAVSLGYFQAAHLALPGRPFVRRYTGGGRVDHACDFTYTLVLPRAHPWLALALPESYRLIHEGVQAALECVGVATILAPVAKPGEAEVCFTKPVRHDLILPNGHKISGAAQRRTREGLLHQGSILLPDPEQNEALRKLFAPAFARRLRLNLESDELSAAEENLAAHLEKTRYGTETWNYRRDSAGGIPPPLIE